MTDEATVVKAPVAPPRHGGADPGGARLVVVDGEGLTGMSVGLLGEVTLGRDPRSEVVLPSEDVSRRHARITPDGASHLLVDLGSTNGTQVNGWNVAQRRLVGGDRLSIGPFTLRYFDAGALEATDVEGVARLARLDPLTGVPNRRAFEEALAGAFARSRQAGVPLALVVADVDGLAAVNAGLGRVAGDAVLGVVAERLAGALRDGDLVARLGGEEFAALLPGAGLAEAEEVAGRLRRRVAEVPVLVGGGALAVTVSLGCAELLPEDDEPAGLLARAGAKLDQAKAAGRNRVGS